MIKRLLVCILAVVMIFNTGMITQASLNNKQEILERAAWVALIASNNARVSERMMRSWGM